MDNLEIGRLDVLTRTPDNAALNFFIDDANELLGRVEAVIAHLQATSAALDPQQKPALDDLRLEATTLRNSVDQLNTANVDRAAELDAVRNDVQACKNRLDALEASRADIEARLTALENPPA